MNTSVLPEGFTLIQESSSELPDGFTLIEEVDETSGAPNSVRMAVAAAKTPEDKLATLRNYYPDAQEHEGNFLFTDPGTGRKTIFNPEGFELGDALEFGREAAEIAGGGIGGAVAAVGGQLGPQALTPEELVTVPAAVGVGATIAGNLYDTLARGIFDVEDTRGAVELAGDGAITTMANATGQRLGELAEYGLKNAVSKGADLVKKPAAEIRDAFLLLKTDPLAGAVSGNRFIQGVEQALARLPASADVIGKKYSHSIDQLDTFIRDLTARLSDRSGTEQLGRSVEQGARIFTQRFQKQAHELYAQVWAKLPKNKRVPIEHFRAALDDISGQFSDDPAFKGILDSPVIKQLAEATEDAPEITLNTLKSLRTKIGSKMDDMNLVDDISQAELKRLYGALSDDIAAAADAAGAGSEFSRANTYWRAGRGRIDDVLNPLVKSGRFDKIYNKVFGSETGSLKALSPVEARALMKSLPHGNKRDVAAEFIRRMGMPSPGAAGAEEAVSFNPGRFLTQYNRLPKETRRVLFGSIRGLDDAVDNLTTVSAAIKDTHAMANNSGTAGQLMFMSLLTGGVGGVYGGTEGAATGVAAALSPYAAAKLMANPRFVRWLAEAGSVAPTNVNSIGPLIGRLYAVAELEPWIRDEVYQYAQGMRSVLNQGDSSGRPDPSQSTPDQAPAVD